MTVSCLLLIGVSITLITCLTLFIGSSTASYVLWSELSSEYVRHHHARMNAIFVMNSILLKTFVCESRTSLPCNVGKPVRLQLELVLCLLPCIIIFWMIAWKTAHASLRSLLQTQCKIPPLVHQWTYPNWRIGSPHLEDILLRKKVNMLLSLYASFKGILSKTYPKRAWQAARYDHYNFLLLYLLYSTLIKKWYCEKKATQRYPLYKQY